MEEENSTVQFNCRIPFSFQNFKMFVGGFFVCQAPHFCQASPIQLVSLLKSWEMNRSLLRCCHAVIQGPVARSLATLGLSGPRSSLTNEDIKKAYRDMAKQHHPDIADVGFIKDNVANANEGDSASRFRDIRTAYETLMLSDRDDEPDVSEELTNENDSCPPDSPLYQSPLFREAYRRRMDDKMHHAAVREAKRDAERAEQRNAKTAGDQHSPLPEFDYSAPALGMETLESNRKGYNGETAMLVVFMLIPTVVLLVQSIVRRSRAQPLRHDK